MTDAKREDKLNPAQSGRSDLPPGKLRSISMDEIDTLQVDRNGRLYWDGKPVEVSRRLTFWQSVGAFIVGTFVVIGSVGSFLQGWTAYHDLACRMGWYTFAVACVRRSRCRADWNEEARGRHLRFRVMLDWVQRNFP